MITHIRRIKNVTLDANVKFDIDALKNKPERVVFVLLFNTKALFVKEG